MLARRPGENGRLKRNVPRPRCHTRAEVRKRHRNQAWASSPGKAFVFHHQGAPSMPSTCNGGSLVGIQTNRIHTNDTRVASAPAERKGAIRRSAWTRLRKLLNFRSAEPNPDSLVNITLIIRPTRKGLEMRPVEGLRRPAAGLRPNKSSKCQLPTPKRRLPSLAALGVGSLGVGIWEFGILRRPC
jgi:hypothetical protein